MFSFLKAKIEKNNKSCIKFSSVVFYREATGLRYGVIKVEINFIKQIILRRIL